MLGHGGFPHCTSISQNSISQALLFPNKPYIYFVSNQVTPSKLASFHGRIGTGLCVFASKIPGNEGNILLERERVVDDKEDGDEEEEFGEDEKFEDDEDEDEEIPLKYMKEWEANKPSGFGEGRVYNTSIEDKLVEEIEQSRLAQAANLNKLKNSPQTPNSKKDSLQKQIASPSGFRVRLTNLPKKKNIDRDLRAAFKGYPGILNIIPAVSGNKKTREPVCKGLAFVDFKSQNEANRFVQLFSGESIPFGKIQKQINCEIINSSSPKTSDKQVVNKINLPPPPADPSSEGDLKNPEFETHFEGAIDDNVSKTRLYTGILEKFTSLDSIDVNSQEQEKEPATNAEPPKSQKKIGAKGKKIAANRKGEKGPKLKIPGSANRLKIRDKTLLTGVFSKYGVKPDLPAKEES